MRKRRKRKGISVHAIAGTEVVLLGLNLSEEAAEGLVGFTIYKHGVSAGLFSFADDGSAARWLGFELPS